MLYEDIAYPLHICPVCEYDLRTASIEPLDNAVDSLIGHEIWGDDIRLSEALTVPVSEFASVLWFVCQLFLRNRPRRKIASVGSYIGDLATRTQQHDARSVEYLPLQLRQEVTDAAGRLFHRWPEDFCEFCMGHGISAESFSENRMELPGWFKHVLDTRLQKQQRGVTDHQVKEAHLSLLKENMKVTKAALGRIVGTKGAKSVKQFVSTRSYATDTEKRMLWHALEAYVAQPAKRKSSREIRYRNAIAISFSVLSHLAEEEVTSLQETDFQDALGKLAARQGYTASEARGVRLLMKFTDKYAKFRNGRSHKRPVQLNSSYLEGFRGNGGTVRSVRVALRECMANFPLELERYTKVFWGYSDQ